MMVTHDSMVASYSQKVLFLRDGVIEHVIEKKINHRQSIMKKLLLSI